MWCAVSCGLWLAFPGCRLRRVGRLAWRGRGCARVVLGDRRVCSWVCGEAPFGIHQFEKVGHLRRSGSVKCPPSCAHPTGARGVCTIDSLRRSTHLFRYYCCPENFKTAEKYTPKPFRRGLRAFFFKKQPPPKKINNDGRIGRPGAGQKNEWACPKRVVQRKRIPLFLWKKNRPLLLLLSVQTPRSVSQSCKCLPIGRDSAFWGCFDR